MRGFPPRQRLPQRRCRAAMIPACARLLLKEFTDSACRMVAHLQFPTPKGHLVAPVIARTLNHTWQMFVFDVAMYTVPSYYFVRSKVVSERVPSQQRQRMRVAPKAEVRHPECCPIRSGLDFYAPEPKGRPPPNRDSLPGAPRNRSALSPAPALLRVWIRPSRCCGTVSISHRQPP